MITAHRFNELKGGSEPTSPEERQDYERLLQWERRSKASKKAVVTKRKKYTKWPTRANDHSVKKHAG